MQSTDRTDTDHEDEMVTDIPVRIQRRQLFASLGALTLMAAAGCGVRSTTSGQGSGTGLWDASVVHTIELTLDRAAYDAMIATFTSTGEKEWLTASVTIDGTTFDEVGVKLKGNSTLRGLGGAGGARGGGTAGDLSADDPQTLPWRIRLDKSVKGQSFGGVTDIVVRANRTQSSLNEAVALALLGKAGLATQQATPTRFRVSGGAEKLRLVIENPTKTWDTATFGTSGVLYKAEAGGDYSYRGADPAKYASAFDIEASPDHPDDDYAPLITFLEWLNGATDAAFGSELDTHVDVAAFTTYLAMQDLIANSDDIDGPGNNSYLRYVDRTRRMTVVAWDHNLAFGSMGGPGGQQGVGRQDQRRAPTGTSAQTGSAPSGAPPNGPDTTNGQPQGNGTMRMGDNVLSKRFTANASYAAQVAERKTALKQQLYASGQAQTILDAWVATLKAGAADLVIDNTLASEAKAISTYFTA